MSPGHAGWREVLASHGIWVHIASMVSSAEEDQPVMLPFQDKEGTGWHVVIRYRTGHERRVDGFATEAEALEWIVANSSQLEE
jgi:predicted secreted protein